MHRKYDLGAGSLPPHRPPVVVMGSRSAVWDDHNIPHGPAGSANFIAGCDIVATFAAFSALNARYQSHKWSRLGLGYQCLLKHMWDAGYPANFPDRKVMCEDWAVPALVEIRRYHPNARPGVVFNVSARRCGGSHKSRSIPQAYGLAGGVDIIAKLEAHRAARNAAAAAAGAGAAGAAAGAAPSTFQPILAVAGVGGTTANGLAGARQFLDDWCALSEAERREIRAFRDWHAANIKP